MQGGEEEEARPQDDGEAYQEVSFEPLTKKRKSLNPDEPKLPQTPTENTGPRLIVILENASLETVKVGKDYQLLNCDDHRTLLRKRKRDPAEYRPDITHQVVDSPMFPQNHTDSLFLISVY